ncbi:MAG: hypothetical protein Q8P76_02415 [bacterium]|nr:hypothetical protein [bacterium]
MHTRLLNSAIQLTRTKKLKWQKVGPDQYFADNGLQHFVLNRAIRFVGPDAGTYFTLSIFVGSISCFGFSYVDKDRSMTHRGLDGSPEVKEIYDLVESQVRVVATF